MEGVREEEQQLKQNKMSYLFQSKRLKGQVQHLNQQVNQLMQQNQHNIVL
jgi:uncharacterized protein (DUF3084 family)